MDRVQGHPWTEGKTECRQCVNAELVLTFAAAPGLQTATGENRKSVEIVLYGVAYKEDYQK